MRYLLRHTRRLLLLGMAMVLTVGLAACADDTAGPEVGADIEDLQQEFAALQEDFAALETRVDDLAAAAEPIDSADNAVMAEEFFANVDSYVGEQVTVSSTVEEILGTNAFLLEGVEQPLLVISATGMGDSEIVEPGAVVQVTGTVQESFEPRDVEDSFGLDFDEGVFAEFEQQTYIVGESVSEAPTSP